MNKRILFFIGGSYVSGLEIVTLHLMRGLVENGYEIKCLVNGWNDGNFKHKLEELGIEYYEVKLGWLHLRKPFWTIDTLFHYPKAYVNVKKILQEFNPDICHFCNFTMPVMLYPLINYKSVYNLQETYQPNIKHRWIFGLLNKKIARFTAVSKHIVRVLEELTIPSSKISLVYNGIPPVSQSQPIVFEESVLIFAIIGQVAEWKGHDILLNAIEILIKKNIQNFKVQIFGNDSTQYGDYLKQKIKQKKMERYFDWKGFVDNQDDIYKDCAVVIVPSLSGEPCSLTIIESMSRGKGLIVSDRGGNIELIQHEENGLIFKADDPEDLSNCMLELINYRKQISFFASNAKQKAMLNYTYNAMTKNYIDIYERL